MSRLTYTRAREPSLRVITGRRFRKWFNTCSPSAADCSEIAYSLGTPMSFQPALARGNVYAGTTQGLLICLKTGNNDADGWYEWGGNAQHNKE